MRFPRLESLLGAPVDALDAAAFQRAVDAGVPEGGDLDWKQTPYATDEKGRHELAKDVVALANSAGGVLVLGVADREGRAVRLTPVPLGEREVLRMRQVLASRVRPFLPGVEMRPVPADPATPGKGFYVLAVPRSADAPHAVVVGDALGYPVRDETTTRWLSEGEVAARYRDRYAARAELTARLERVHEEGAARLVRADRAWLAVAAVPTLPGVRAGGAAAVGRARGFLLSWARHACPVTAPAGYADSGLDAVPGVRRVLVSATRPYAGSSADVHLELHHDGAGFASVAIGQARRATPAQLLTQGPSVVLRDEVELTGQTLVSLLSAHAVDTIAGGDLLLRAQLLLAQPLGPPASPAELHASRRLPGGLVLPAERVPQTLTLMATSPTFVTTLLAELVAEARGSVRAAYPLVADVLAEFGVAEPAVLRTDGVLAPEALNPQYGQRVRAWAMQHGLVDEAG